MVVSKDDPRLRLRDFLISGIVPSPATGDDAETLAATAREQGLVGLLHTGILSSSNPGTWPLVVREGLRDTHRALLVRGVRQLDRAAEVQERLFKRGLRVLPLKGAALAESVYDSVADRPMADVDLLALDDWPDSVRLLEEMGFRETARGDHARAFADPTSGSVLELHHAVTSCPGLFPIDPDGLWHRGLTGSGALGRIPAPEDLLVHLSLHAAFQHGLVLSLVQYLDFRRVLERLRPDVATVRQRAADARAEPALGAALRVAATVVGASQTILSVPTPLDSWLEARTDDATRFLVPAVPALARVRIGVAAGQRLNLVLRTMASAEPGDRRSRVERGRAVVRRTVRLAGLGWQAATASLRTLPAPGLPSVRRRGEAPLVVDGAVESVGPEFGEMSGIAPGETPTADGLDALREAALRACLAEFPHVRLTVSGDCMTPVLVPGQAVFLARPGQPARVGDIVLVRAPAGLRLHRLVWGPPLTGPTSRVRTKGDHSLAFDPPLDLADVLGVVIEVEGGGLARGTFWRARTVRSLIAGLRAAARARLPWLVRTEVALRETRE